MADQWDKYIVDDQETTDEWDKYVVSESGKGKEKGRVQEQNILGQIFNVPGAAIRSGLLGRGYVQGALNPDEVPKFQDVLLDKYYKMGNQEKAPSMLKVLGGNTVSTLGMAADIATNPAGMLLGLSGKIPLGQGKNLGKIIGNSVPAKEFSKFMNKQRGFIKIAGEKTAQKIAEKADEGLGKVSEFMSKKYDDFFEKIKDVKGKVSPSKIIDEIDNVTTAYPTQDVGNLSKIKDQLLKIKEDGISAKELHNLKQEVRKLVPKSVWQGKVPPDALQSSKQEVYYRITDALGELGGEEYKQLSKDYRTFKEAQRLVGKLIYNEGVPSNMKLANKMDVPQKRAMNYLNDILPKEDKFLADFEAYRRGESLKKIVANPLTWALGGTAYAISKK